ncbi:MAG: hypothetical protein PF904_15575 [Kiritimatiellae bacterium]|jgi:hypothetical protein|nr:hypothetical protein [Kiritimatiellia bacterium]
MKLKISAFLCLGILIGVNAVVVAEPFRDGDRVCFVGDSITKQGGYHAQILLFYATRYPDINLQMWNNYRCKMIESYLATAGGKAAVEEECSRLLEQIYKINKPKRHHYEVVRF